MAFADRKSLAAHRYKFSKFLISLDGSSVGKPGFIFLYSTRTGRLAKVPSSLGDALLQSFVDEQRFEELSSLIDKGIIVPISQNEIVALAEENQLLENNRKALRFVFQPSGFCQMECGYCGQDHVNEKSHRNVIRDSVSFLDRMIGSRNIELLELGFFGAEAMTGFPEIQLFCDLLKPTLSKYSCRVMSKLVTNGLSVTPSRIAFLKGNAGLASVEVTLDGPPGIHEQSRPMRGGKNESFVRILRNTEMLSRTGGVLTVIRINVSSANVGHISKLLKILANSEIDRNQATVYFAPVHSWGNDAHKSALDPDTFAELDVGWRAMLLNLGWDVGQLPKRRVATCIATTDDGWVVDHSGGVFDCTEKPLVGSYSDHRKGSISDLASGVPLRADRSFRQFGPDLPTSSMCGQCFALPVCGGRCPKEWAEGRIPCPSFKLQAENYLRLAFAAKSFGEKM